MILARNKSKHSGKSAGVPARRSATQAATDFSVTSSHVDVTANVTLNAEGNRSGGEAPVMPMSRRMSRSKESGRIEAASSHTEAAEGDGGGGLRKSTFGGQDRHGGQISPDEKNFISEDADRDGSEQQAVEAGVSDGPTIGTVRIHRGQSFELVEVKPHRCLDGREIEIQFWRTNCAVCGSPFEFRQPSTWPKFQPSRNCGDHRLRVRASDFPHHVRRVEAAIAAGKLALDRTNEPVVSEGIKLFGLVLAFLRIRDGETVGFTQTPGGRVDFYVRQRRNGRGFEIRTLVGRLYARDEAFDRLWSQRPRPMRAPRPALSGAGE